MNITIQNGIKALSGIVIALLCAVSFAPFASAQSYYYPQYYYPYTTATYSNTADIQKLLNQVYALLAQLQALQGYSGGYNYYTPGKVKTYTHTYKPSSDDYDIEVETTDVDVDGDEEATFYGEIDLDDASYANVWFQYGQDGRMNEKTDEMRIDDEDDEEFEADVDDLDEDERYFVRAVAEDPSGYLSYGDILAFTTGDDDDDDDDDDNEDEDTPDATTEDAEDVDDDSAELHGEIDMNDFDDGLAFFVYGQDEDQVEDVEDEDMYSDIDEDGDDLQKFSVSSNLNGSRTFWATITGLDEDTEYFFRICVEYEDEDDDETLACGDVESFTTDED